MNVGAGYISQLWLYLPSHSIGADVLLLSRHVSPEGSDCVLVLSSECSHLVGWLSVAECHNEAKPRGVLCLKPSMDTPRTSSKIDGEQGVLRCSLHEINKQSYHDDSKLNLKASRDTIFSNHQHVELCVYLKIQSKSSTKTS